MKYLKDRTIYLNGLKSIETYLSINEEVMENSITWGDSLLGRLVNSTIRKAKIGVNLKRIKSVEDRLRDTFDQLLLNSNVAEFDEEDKKQYAKILMFSFLLELQNSVNVEEINLNEIKNLTNECIKKAESDKNIPNQNELLLQLKEWKKFIDSIKEDVKSETTESVDVDIYPLCIKNLKSTYDIINEYTVLIKKSSEKFKGTSPKPKNDNEESDDNLSMATESAQPTTQSPIIPNIKSLYDYFKSQQGGIEELGRFFQSGDDKGYKLKYKPYILKMYNIIRKKSGINENLDVLLSSPEKLADKLFKLYESTKSGNFQGVQDNMKTVLIDFNKTMKDILDYKSATDKKTESIIFDYNGFKINEDTNSTTTVKSHWEKNVNLDKWVMDKSESEKIKNDLDKKLSEKKDSIKINGTDPIIDIVKIFNRAYKLHTTQVIPTGRSGGKVSNKTFMEYTTFGSGTPETAGSSGGPYRNNAIFDSWESSVLNILKDKKYQPIFSKDTVINVGESSDSSKLKTIESAGTKLRRFIIEMIDGETLYKSGGKGDGLGAQSKFLEEYFGISKKPSDLTFNGSEEAKAISENSDNIKGPKLTFTKNPVKFEDVSELKNSFFTLNVKGGNDLNFFVQDIKGDSAYLVYCESFYFFNKYINQSGISSKVDGGSFGKNFKSGQFTEAGGKSEYSIRLVKVKVDKLIDKNGSIKLPNSITIKPCHKKLNPKGLMINKTKESELGNESNYKIDGLYTLMDGENRFNIKNDKSLPATIKNVGGFDDVVKNPYVDSTIIK